MLSDKCVLHLLIIILFLACHVPIRNNMKRKTFMKRKTSTKRDVDEEEDTTFTTAEYA